MTAIPGKINPNAAQPTSISALLTSLRKNRYLVLHMTQREIVGRYRGSVMGLAWSFFNPMLMLAVYTFVFSVVFKARWGGADIDESRGMFAIVLFVGMITHSLFAEVINRAPTLIISNVNYVKRVIFPLEALPVISICTALFHATVSMGILLGAFIIMKGYIHWTVVFLPIVIMPLIILTLGFAWALASLGVFLRDVSQTISIITTIMLFLAPVMYPISAVPPKLQLVIMANPLTFIINQARAVLIFGNQPQWLGLAIYFLVATLIAWGGFAWFQKTRKGFADVL